MTIDVVVTVPEGIALSADTLVKNFKKTDAEPEAPPKLFHLVIDKKSYAVCIAGQGELKGETVYSIFKSLEKTFNIENPAIDQITSYFVEGLKKRFQKKFDQEDIGNAVYCAVHFLFCGFENNDLSKPIVQEHIVFSGSYKDDGVENKTGHIIRTTNQGDNKYSAFAIGIKGEIKHLISRKDGQPPEESENFQSMSLKEASDYSNTLVGIMCEKDKDCGRPIRSVILTPNNYQEKIIS
jgi:hypothetical protein